MPGTVNLSGASPSTNMARAFLEAISDPESTGERLRVLAEKEAAASEFLDKTRDEAAAVKAEAEEAAGAMRIEAAREAENIRRAANEDATKTRAEAEETMAEAKRVEDIANRRAGALEARWRELDLKAADLSRREDALRGSASAVTRDNQRVQRLTAIMSKAVADIQAVDERGG